MSSSYPEQMVKAQKRLTEESDILVALDTQQFSIWLQPQVEKTGESLQRRSVATKRQPDGNWDPPMLDHIESCGLMVTVGHWVLEELLPASGMAVAWHYAAAVGEHFRATALTSRYGFRHVGAA
ncbi:hypothetical protein ACLK2H_19790 [Escherichia coli]